MPKNAHVKYSQERPLGPKGQIPLQTSVSAETSDSGSALDVVPKLQEGPSFQSVAGGLPFSQAIGHLENAVSRSPFILLKHIRLVRSTKGWHKLNQPAS